MEKRPKLVKGKVIKGSGDGRKLGFPTVNVDFTNDPLLEFGVYACILEVEGKKYKGVMHFGPRYVFGEENPKLEAHIFDFEDNIYDRHVIVYIYDFLRPSIKFNSLLDLVAQMTKDKSEAKEVLTNISI